MRRDYCFDCDSYLLPIDSLPVKQITANDLFGEQTVLLTETTSRIPQKHAIDYVQRAPFDFFVLVILIFYISILYYFRGNVGKLVKLLAHLLSHEKLLEQQPQFFLQFMHNCQLLGIFLLTTMVTWGIYQWAEGLILLLPAPLRSWIFVAIGALFALICLYRFVLLKLLAVLSQNRPFFLSINLIGQLSFSAASLCVAPVLLIVVLNKSIMLNFGIYALLTILLFFGITYILKSYRFFVNQNVSTLQWFLYLCTVEIFPISFFVLLGLRNG